MADRFYCPIHRKSMTDARKVHSGQMVRRCADCVVAAREKVQAHIAAYEADKKDTRSNRFQCVRAT